MRSTCSNCDLFCVSQFAFRVCNKQHCIYIYIYIYIYILFVCWICVANGVPNHFVSTTCTNQNFGHGGGNVGVMGFFEFSKHDIAVEIAKWLLPPTFRCFGLVGDPGIFGKWFVELIVFENAIPASVANKDNKRGNTANMRTACFNRVFLCVLQFMFRFHQLRFGYCKREFPKHFASTNWTNPQFADGGWHFRCFVMFWFRVRFAAQRWDCKIVVAANGSLFRAVRWSGNCWQLVRNN